MSMMKKLTLLLALLMLMAWAAGCAGAQTTTTQGTSATTTQATSGTTATTAEPQNVNAYGWPVPEETLTITYYAGRGEKGDQAEEDKYNQPMADFLKENFNVVLNKIVFNMDMVEKLNLMLATGDYPEVIAHMPDDMAEQFISQGKALELTDLVETHGQNIVQGMGNYINLLKNDQGQLFKLSSHYGNTTDGKGRDFEVRYDLWKASGLPMYTNMEEYYEVIKAIVAANPTNANGEKVYGISSNDQGMLMYETPLGAFGFINGFKEDENGNFVHWINTQEGLYIAKYINRFYREDLIDPDFLNNKWEDWQAKVTNERVIGMIGNWWHVYVAGHEAWIPLEGADYNPEKRFVNVSLKEAGVEKHTLLRNDFIRTNRTIITDKCTQPEKVMEWFNWENTEMGRLIVAYGVPGPTNVYDFVGGKAIFKDEVFYGTDINNQFHLPRSLNGAYTYWISAPAYTPIVSDQSFIDERIMRGGMNIWGFSANIEQLDMSKFDAIKRLDLELAKYYETDLTDNALYNPVFKPDDPVTVVNQNIKDTLNGEWAKIITASSEAECESLFMAARQKLNDLKLADLEKFYQETYQKNKDKFDGKFGG